MLSGAGSVEAVTMAAPSALGSEVESRGDTFWVFVIDLFLN